MPLTTNNVVMNLETLYFVIDPPYPAAELDVLVWTVFFKLDGATTQVSDAGKWTGTATVSGTTGVGSLCRLKPGSSTAIPAEIGQWSGQVVPIPGGLIPDQAGVFGVALVIVEQGDLEADQLVAGHAALNDGLRNALNDMIAKLPPFQKPGPDQINAVAEAVRGAIKSAIHHAAEGVWDTVHLIVSPPLTNSTSAHYMQDELPAVGLDQKDFDPTSADGPSLMEFLDLVPVSDRPVLSLIGLNGAISRSQRAVGQGVLGQLPPPVRAVAGFTSPDGYQHAVAATGDGAVTEMYWQGQGPVGSGLLARFSSQIIGLAGYSTADGYQHVIAATDDGNVTEVYWQGPNPPGQGVLSHLGSQILAIAGYASGDGYQHVIVATDDGNVTEVYWQGTSAPGQGSLTQLSSPVVDLAGYETAGVNHVIAATADGTLTELTWSGSAAASTRTLGQVEAQPWNHVLGVGAYAAAQEQHVIAGMSNGTLREFHTAEGDPAQLLHIDLATIPGIVPIIDAYAESNGEQHTIFATDDGSVHELWWSATAGELQVVGIAGGQLWHTIRHADGTWVPGFGLIEAQEQNDPGAFTAVSCAGVLTA